MKLFRQQQMNNWSTVIEAVVNELQQFSLLKAA
jgi:hypothetical protein